MKQAPALHTHARVHGVRQVGIFKVLTAEEARSAPFDPASILIYGDDSSEGFAGRLSPEEPLDAEGVSVSNLRQPDAIQPGDIVRLRPSSTLVSILYRRGANANSLFVTEQCNSMCLMCSQPPRDEDDSWRLGELHQILALIDRDEGQLGFTGGEPTLFGTDFAKLLAAARESLPGTIFHVLTNGRLLRDPILARVLASSGGDQTVWAIPVYGDNAENHDHIVAAPGAFSETIDGIFQLAILKARVEIRVVLHKLSVSRLHQLASFIYRRMPFVEHVALMGLEPMGFARQNRSQLWIDPIDYVETLGDAVHHLDSRSIPVSIYNLPHCVLPPSLRPFARASISDWKNRSDPLCLECAAKESCSGFFRSADHAWRSRGIRTISSEEISDGLA